MAKENYITTTESWLMKANGIKISFMAEEKFIMMMQSNCFSLLTIITFKTQNNTGNFMKVKVF